METLALTEKLHISLSNAIKISKKEAKWHVNTSCIMSQGTLLFYGASSADEKLMALLFFPEKRLSSVANFITAYEESR